MNGLLKNYGCKMRRYKVKNGGVLNNMNWIQKQMTNRKGEVLDDIMKDEWVEGKRK